MQVLMIKSFSGEMEDNEQILFRNCQSLGAEK